MSRTPPPSLRSLEARLRDLAREQELPEGRVRRLIGIVVVGQLLARTEAAAVKGASSLEIRVGTRRARVSSDLDAVRRQSLDAFRDHLAEALRDGWDGFTGVLIDDGEIPAPVPEGYRPHRFRAKLQFRGGDFGTVLIEVAPTEIGADHEVDPVAVRDAGAWFPEIGLTVPGPVPTLPLNHQIVQKLHAYTLPDTEQWINDRAHDLVDLQLALRVYDGSLADLRDVATRLFAARRQHAWPPEVTERERWADRYAAEAQGLNVLENLDDAIAWANRLIEQIESLSMRAT